VNYSLRISYERSELKRYKIFIGKGNNSKLVKSIFSSRFWWSLTEDKDEANLIWTQKSKKRFFETILDMEKDKIKIEISREPIILRRKIKIKRKDNKKIFFDEDTEGILSDKDKLFIKN
jgi:hypothetical protein